MSHFQPPAAAARGRVGRSPRPAATTAAAVAVRQIVRQWWARQPAEMMKQHQQQHRHRLVISGGGCGGRRKAGEGPHTFVSESPVLLWVTCCTGQSRLASATVKRSAPSSEKSCRSHPCTNAQPGRHSGARESHRESLRLWRTALQHRRSSCAGGGGQTGRQREKQNAPAAAEHTLRWRLP